MIDEVMYGPTPSINIDRCESPPPVKILRVPRNWLLLKKASSFILSIPGIGIPASNRNTIRASSTNKTRDLSVLSVNIVFILFQTVSIIILYFHQLFQFFLLQMLKLYSAQ